MIDVPLPSHGKFGAALQVKAAWNAFKAFTPIGRAKGLTRPAARYFSGFPIPCFVFARPIFPERIVNIFALFVVVVMLVVVTLSVDAQGRAGQAMPTATIPR